MQPFSIFIGFSIFFFFITIKKCRLYPLRTDNMANFIPKPAQNTGWTVYMRIFYWLIEKTEFYIFKQF